MFEPIGTDKEGNEIHLLDVIEAEERNMDDVVTIRQDVLRLYSVFCDVLTDKERKVLMMRYGLYGQRECTQKEIAGQMSISRSYVSRIEKAALLKLKTIME